MRALLVIAIALAGCEKMNPKYCPAHPEDPDCGGVRMDGDIVDGDADDPTTDARLDFGEGLYAVHVSGPPAMPSVMFNPGAQLNTDTSTLCLTAQPGMWNANGQPDACFVHANNITVQDGLDVIGMRPLVLLGANSITINGTLDVASKVATGKIGPGSQAQTGCQPFAGTPASNGTTGSGGAGGSFISKAGDGGASGGQGAGRAAMADQLAPMRLRGGCDGQTGAAGTMDVAGAKGRGGGAVFLLAGRTITLGATAIINASGSGGGQSGKGSGGGGGGSGGMIVLYATTINATGAKLAANGGSGSTGSNNGTGTIGNDPNPASPETQAAGPTGSGGAGGAGWAGGNDATNGGTSSNGGGGGGGASGFIMSNVALTDAVASPGAVTGP